MQYIISAIYDEGKFAASNIKPHNLPSRAPPLIFSPVSESKSSCLEEPFLCIFFFNPNNLDV